MTAPSSTPPHDLVIVGGGPAGSAAALWLARSGARVLLLERTTGPHDKVCGEFVSTEAVDLLAELGLDVTRLGAVPMRVGGLVRGSRAVRFPLPFPAVSLSRRKLDEALLTLAAESGVEVRRGVCVRAATVQPDGTGIELSMAGGECIRTPALFLATGKHDLRGLSRGPGLQSGLLGLKMHLHLPPGATAGLEGVSELLLYAGGYAGIQPLEGGRANLCLLIQADHYRRLGRSWPRLMSHLAGESSCWAPLLRGARPLWDRPLAIAGIPYGYLAAPSSGPVLRLGDQMAVIPSFAGDGIAIALTSARLAADAWAEAGGDPQQAAQAYHRVAARRFAPVRPAAQAARLMERPVPQALLMTLAAAYPTLLSRIAMVTRLGKSTSDLLGSRRTAPI